MIKKWIQSSLKKIYPRMGGFSPKASVATYHTGAALGIGRQHIDQRALSVVKTLQKAGFDAYVVGGAVRDILLGFRPKDFDVATNATPEQVEQLFRRSRTIGRRFQIVHVYFGREVIEVTTFRGVSNDWVTVGESKVVTRKMRANAVKDESGRLLRDNVWGTISEDAMRRDFTINALYYDPTRDQVIDFHGGVDDLRHKRLRLIGDPSVRYREDPVRMLRAVRLAAKTGCDIDATCRTMIPQLANLLTEVSPSRLFDEMLKLLMSGHARKVVDALENIGLIDQILPMMQSRGVEDSYVVFKRQFINQVLQATDDRLAQSLSVSPGFLLAGLYWPKLCGVMQRQRSSAGLTDSQLQAAMGIVVPQILQELPIPGRILGMMREIWLLQPRLHKRTAKIANRLIELPRYRAAYDFLLLREQVYTLYSNQWDMIENGIGRWWTDYAALPEEREALLSEVLTISDQRKSSRRRRRKKPVVAVQLEV